MTETQMRTAIETGEKRYQALLARVELLELALADYIRSPKKSSSHPAPSTFGEKKTS